MHGDQTPQGFLLGEGDSDEELTREEEEEIRARARQRLLEEEAAARAREEARLAQRQRRSESERMRWKIVEEETERFHRERGRVRYVSSSGQVLWLTPEEIRLRRLRRARGRRKGRSSSAIRPARMAVGLIRTAGVSLAITLALVVAAAAVIYVVEFT